MELNISAKKVYQIIWKCGGAYGATVESSQILAKLGKTAVDFY